MTKLLDAAQKLITCLQLDRFDVGDWPDDSLKAYNELKQAIADEQANSCDTCIRKDRHGYHKVCLECSNFCANHWEPKP